MTPDIAIVGGGPSGLALAGILERAGFSYVVFERSAEDVPPRGGCLDLHEGSGQLAMQEAGCYEKFREYGRSGDATTHVMYDHLGNRVSSWGEGEDQPELDREQIKQALLTTIPKENIQRSKGVGSTERSQEGEIVLMFKDGMSARGFKLVVGADGLSSKVRHLVTDVEPTYSGQTFWTGEIHQSNPFYPKVEERAKLGPMVIMGRSTMIWNQRQGDGHYRIELGFMRPKDFAETGPVDVSDTEAVKKLMLTDEFFGGHGEFVKDMISAIDTGFHLWLLHYISLESLNWEAKQDVTLIGDAAHVTTPFIGEGVNLAMTDSVMLVRKLKEFGISLKAIQEYEKDMFVRARDVIEKSVKSGELYFDWNAPKTVLDAHAPSDAGQSTKLAVQVC